MSLCDITIPKVTICAGSKCHLYITKTTHFKVYFLVMVKQHHNPQPVLNDEATRISTQWNNYLDRCLKWWGVHGGMEAGFLWKVDYKQQSSICPETRYDITQQQVSEVIIIQTLTQIRVSDILVVDSLILDKHTMTVKNEEPVIFTIPLKRLKNRGKRIRKEGFQKVISLLKIK